MKAILYIVSLVAFCGSFLIGAIAAQRLYSTYERVVTPEPDAAMAEELVGVFIAHETSSQLVMCLAVMTLSIWAIAWGQHSTTRSSAPV